MIGTIVLSIYLTYINGTDNTAYIINIEANYNVRDSTEATT